MHYHFWLWEKVAEGEYIVYGVGARYNTRQAAHYAASRVGRLEFEVRKCEGRYIPSACSRMAEEKEAALWNG